MCTVSITLNHFSQSLCPIKLVSLLLCPLPGKLILPHAVHMDKSLSALNINLSTTLLGRNSPVHTHTQPHLISITDTLNR
jgi:hypothetical protein